MILDDTWVTFREVAENYDPTDLDVADACERQKAGEVLTGRLHVLPDSRDMAEHNNLTWGALTSVPFDHFCPGSAEVEWLQARFLPGLLLS